MKYLMTILSDMIKVNPATGDTIVRQRYVTQSEIHKYRGNFECIGNKWRLHTETGFYDISSNQNHYYIKDNQGSIVTVVSENGAIEEQTAYYPTGVPYRIFDRQPVTDRKHIGNEWLAFNGLNTYDNTARYHYPIIPSYDTIDPNAEDYPGISPYAHCAGNPRNVIDPSGQIPLWNGKYGRDTQYTDSDTGQVLTWSEVENYLKYGAYDGPQQLEYDSSLSNTEITPFELGVEWLTGEGERKRIFTDKDKMTELLKKHDYLKGVRSDILKCVSNKVYYSVNEKGTNYKLSGIDGVWKYIMDYSTLMTFGKTGNLAVTYLGSYELNWSVVEKSNRYVNVIFEVNNCSSLASATRPPVLGYVYLWQKYISGTINKFTTNGMFSPTYQKFVWSERLKIK